MRRSRGVCRVCGQGRQISNTGKVYVHGPKLDPCPGSGEPPRDSAWQMGVTLADAIEALPVQNLGGEPAVLLADVTAVIDQHLAAQGLPPLGGTDG